MKRTGNKSLCLIFLELITSGNYFGSTVNLRFKYLLIVNSFSKPASQNTISQSFKRETLSSISVSDLSPSSTFSYFPSLDTFKSEILAIHLVLFKFEDGGNSSLYHVFFCYGKVSLPVTLAIKLNFLDLVFLVLTPDRERKCLDFGRNEMNHA